MSRSKIVVGLFTAFSLLALPTASNAQTAEAPAVQVPRLVDRWLDGEIDYAPEITYDGRPIQVRFSSFLSPQTPIAKVMLRAFKRLEEDSNGKLRIRPFWTNTLADAAAGGFDAVSQGIADLGSCYTFMNPGGFTLQLGIQMPFMIETSAAGSRTIAELYPEFMKGKYEGRGVYFARSTVTPPNQILTRDAPVKTIADLQGKKMWAVGDIPSRLATVLGAVPVPLAPSELYVSFQTGVLDVVPMHDAGVITFRLNEVAKYKTTSNLSANATEYCMNRAFFDGLPEDLKGLFYHWLQLWNHAEAELYYDQVAVEGRKSLEENGVQTTELTPEQRQEWQVAIQPVVDGWVEQMAAGGEAGDAFLKRFRATNAELVAAGNDAIFQKILDEPVPDLVTGYTFKR